MTDIRPALTAELIRLGWIPPDGDIEASLTEALAPVMATLEMAAADNAARDQPSVLIPTTEEHASLSAIAAAVIADREGCDHFRNFAPGLAFLERLAATTRELDLGVGNREAPRPRGEPRKSHERVILQRGVQLANDWAEGIEIESLTEQEARSLTDQAAIAAAYALLFREFVGIAFVPPDQRMATCAWCVAHAGNTMHAFNTGIVRSPVDARVHAFTCPHAPWAKILDLARAVPFELERHGDQDPSATFHLLEKISEATLDVAWPTPEEMERAK